MTFLRAWRFSVTRLMRSRVLGLGACVMMCGGELGAEDKDDVHSVSLSSSERMSFSTGVELYWLFMDIRCPLEWECIVI